MVDLEKLFSDEEFVSKIANVKTDEEFKQIFKDHGLELTDEQVEAIKVNLKKITDEEIGEVSGGEGPEVTVGLTVDEDKAAAVAGTTLFGAGIGAYVGYIRGAINARNTFKGGTQTDAFKHVFKSACKGALKGAGVGAGAGALASTLAIGVGSTVKGARVTREPRKW